MTDRLSRVVPSADGTPIAVYSSGTGPPLILVHGASADHTTFRVIGPRLAERFTVHAIDRRGRGGSGDTPPYDIEREFEDVAAVAQAVAGEAVDGEAVDGEAAPGDPSSPVLPGPPVDVFGHSYGGRCALGAAARSDAIRRVISYEGAPTPPGARYGDSTILGDLVRLAELGKFEDLLGEFLRRVVGMTPEDLADYAADPVWPDRVAAAPTIVRELAAEGSGAGPGGLDDLAAVRQPVLQLLGGASRPEFGLATRALDARLADGRVVVIPGARHAAHHTHPDAVLDAITGFLVPATIDR
ncbi:MAG: alpha/beta hydrolase [Candidatus Limnocylindrales bacterium]